MIILLAKLQWTSSGMATSFDNELDTIPVFAARSQVDSTNTTLPLETSNYRHSSVVIDIGHRG